MGTAELANTVSKAKGNIPSGTHFVQLPGPMFVGVGNTLAEVVAVAVGVLVIVGMASTQ